MNCHECEALLQRQLDGETLVQAELDRHLAQCSNCRSLFAAGQLLLSGLRRMPAPVPPEALTRRIVNRVLEDHIRSYRRVRWAVAVAMVAASVLFVVWVYYYVQPDNTGPAALPMAKADDANRDKGNSSDKDKNQQAIQQARHALDHLTTRIIDRSRKEVDETPEVTVLVEGPRLDQLRDLADIRLARQRSGMAIGLQTVAATTRRGLDFMLRDNPRVEPKNNE
jgi:hypothetical protein